MSSLDKNKQKDPLEFIRNSTANNDMLDKFGMSRDLYDAEEDLVDHPSYYGGRHNAYEAINVIEAWSLNFHCGNVVKYIARHKEKDDPRQDIEKAIWYLQRYLEAL